MTHVPIKATDRNYTVFKAGVDYANDSAVAHARNVLQRVVDHFAVPEHKRCLRTNCADCVSNDLAIQLEALLKTVEVDPNNYVDDLTRALDAGLMWIKTESTIGVVRNSQRPDTAMELVHALVTAADARTEMNVTKELGIRYEDGRVIRFDTVEPEDVMEGDVVVTRTHYSRYTAWRKVPADEE